ncbi:MAG TPA: hypothetical protein VF316_09010 [Polyangiaceae bacterium]
MTRFPKVAFVLSIGLGTLAALPGCGASSSETTAQTAQGATRAPFVQPAQGVVKMMLVALGDVPLRADQRATIDQMAKDAEARHDGVRAAREAMMLAVADQIQAGAIDRAALQPKIDALTAAMDKARPADRAAFEKLHALLDANQRVAFVDAFQAPAPGHGGPGEGMDRMRKLGDELKLTDDQRAKIHELMSAEMHGDHGPGGDRGPRGDHGPGPGMPRGGPGGKVMEAFKGDHFVLDEVAPPPDAKEMGKGGDRMLRLAEIALPILTPEQRTALAGKIRDHAKSEEME